jgi:hypothetical protein
VFGVGLVLAVTSGPALAQQAGGRGSQARSNPAIQGTTDTQPTQLAFNSQDKNKSAPAPNKTATTEKTTVRTETKTVGEFKYREISSFFNIREAYSNVEKGVWELEFESAWETGNGGDDDVFFGAALKYGFSDTTWLELEVVPINLGDGGDQGAGELELALFHQWTSESDSPVAFATWVDMRIPSGQGSSGVDGTLHGAITKSLGGNWRAHLNGYVMTANGEMGGDDDDNGSWGDDERADRRDFQWGIGPGLDYQFNEETIGTINYINRSSDQNGESNDGIVEVGVVRKIADKQYLKFGVDFDVHGGNDDIPNVAAKVQWSIEW